MSNLEDTIWGSALASALDNSTDPRVSEVLRRREVTPFASMVADLMEIYGFNVDYLCRIDSRVGAILDKVDLPSERNSNLEFERRRKFQSLVNQLKYSILEDKYGEYYDLALQLFAVCIEYFIDIVKYQEVRDALDISLNQDQFKVDYSEQTVNFSVRNLNQAEPIHNLELIESEYERYMELLEHLLRVSSGFSNIHDIVLRLWESTISYYSGNEYLFKNEVSRSIVSDPKEYLKLVLESQLEYQLSFSYFIDDPTDFGRIRRRGPNEKNGLEDAGVDELVKGIIKEYYLILIEESEKIPLSGNYVKRSGLDFITPRAIEFFDQWLDKLDMGVFRTILTESHDLYDDHETEYGDPRIYTSKVDCAMNSPYINFESSATLLDRIKIIVGNISEIFGN